MFCLVMKSQTLRFWQLWFYLQNSLITDRPQGNFGPGSDFSSKSLTLGSMPADEENAISLKIEQGYTEKVLASWLKVIMWSFIWFLLTFQCPIGKKIQKEEWCNKFDWNYFTKLDVIIALFTVIYAFILFRWTQLIHSFLASFSMKLSRNFTWGWIARPIKACFPHRQKTGLLFFFPPKKNILQTSLPIISYFQFNFY